MSFPFNFLAVLNAWLLSYLLTIKRFMIQGYRISRRWSDLIRLYTNRAFVALSLYFQDSHAGHEVRIALFKLFVLLWIIS